jgi:hypothetical protein
MARSIGTLVKSEATSNNTRTSLLRTWHQMKVANEEEF